MDCLTVVGRVALSCLQIWVRRAAVPNLFLQGAICLSLSKLTTPDLVTYFIRIIFNNMCNNNSAEHLVHYTFRSNSKQMTLFEKLLRIIHTNFAFFGQIKCFLLSDTLPLCC